MTPESIRILLIEDNPGDARLIQKALSSVKNLPFQMEQAGDLSTGLERLSRENIDIVLLDLSLPDSRGFATFATAHTRFPKMPIVLLTGLDDEELGMKALQQGGQDYLIKGQVDGKLLARVIRYAVERNQVQRLKENFIHNVNHELRTPLSSLSCSLQVLLDGTVGQLNEEQRKTVEIALRGADHLSSMVEDLIETTKAESGKLSIKPRPTALGDMIPAILAELQAAAAKKHLQLSSDISRNLPPAFVDPNRFRQILLNLINNAVKFTPENGKITVKALRSDPHPGSLLIEVEDTGCGIKPENLGRIFERLYQAEQPKELRTTGLGIGLYICQELVSRHGGKIWAESRPGKGSCFSFTLPMFTIQELLSNVLVKKGVLAESIALIIIDLIPSDTQLTDKAKETILQEVRNIIKSDTLADDVLLPAMGGPGSEGILFLVVRTDQAGAETIAKRLQTHLDRCDALKHHRLVPTFDLSVLGTQEQGSAPLTTRVQKISAEIEARVTQALSQRGKSENFAKS